MIQVRCPNCAYEDEASGTPSTHVCDHCGLEFLVEHCAPEAVNKPAEQPAAPTDPGSNEKLPLESEHGTPSLVFRLRRPRIGFVLASGFWALVFGGGAVAAFNDGSTGWGTGLAVLTTAVVAMVVVQIRQYSRGTAQVVLTDKGIWTSLEFIPWAEIQNVSVKEIRAGAVGLDHVIIKVTGRMLPSTIDAAELETSGVSLASAIRSSLQEHAGWDENRTLVWDVDGQKSRF